MHHPSDRHDHGRLVQPARLPAVQPAVLLQRSMDRASHRDRHAPMDSPAVSHDQTASNSRYIARSASEKQQKMTCRTAETEARQAWTVPMAIRAAASRG